jgi:hypothetical protein
MEKRSYDDIRKEEILKEQNTPLRRPVWFNPVHPRRAA